MFPPALIMEILLIYSAATLNWAFVRGLFSRAQPGRTAKGVQPLGLGDGVRSPTLSHPQGKLRPSDLRASHEALGSPASSWCGCLCWRLVGRPRHGQHWMQSQGGRMTRGSARWWQQQAALPRGISEGSKGFGWQRRGQRTWSKLARAEEALKLGFKPSQEPRRSSPSPESAGRASVSPLLCSAVPAGFCSSCCCLPGSSAESSSVVEDLCF